MGRVDMMRCGVWPLSGQPPDHASDRCYVSCSLLFVVIWLPLVVFLRCGKRRVVTAEAVGGVPGVPGLAEGSGGEGVDGGAGVAAMAGVREWRGRRECRSGGVGGGAGVAGMRAGSVHRQEQTTVTTVRKYAAQSNH